MYEIIVAFISLAGAVLLGRISGQWGSVRRIERLAELASKVEVAVARRELQAEVADQVRHELKRQHERSGPGLVFIVLYALAISSFAQGWISGLPGTDLVEILGAQVRATMIRFGLTRNEAIAVTVISRVQVALILACVAYYVIKAATSLRDRFVSWDARRAPTKPPRTAPRWLVGVGVVVQILFVLLALLPGFEVLVLAVRAWIGT